LRYYPYLENSSTTASYKTVEIEKTDVSGQTLAKMYLGDVWYKYIVEYPIGTVVLNTDIEKILTTSKLLPIGINTAALTTYDALTKISGSVSIDKPTQTAIFTWNNPANVDVTGELRVFQNTGYTKLLIASERVTSSSATIAIVIPENVTGKKYVAQGWFIS